MRLRAGRALAGLFLLAASAPAFAGPPRTIFIPPNNYPEGVQPGPDRLRVQVRYELGDDGRFTLCEVQRPSGRAEIDEASCELLRKRARFRPEAETRRGRLTLVWQQESVRTSNGPGAPIAIALFDEIYSSDYPTEALRRNESGRVEYEMAVSMTGVPQACTVVASSGSEILDRRTCAIAMERSAFIPAANGAGDPTNGTFRTSITWRMDEN